ncbi:MAG: hypothetical protein NTV57_12665 [Cyanobacteria bacterium]|nr:hypothetical protein [Cyanobacteriota bacterium]
MLAVPVGRHHSRQHGASAGGTAESEQPLKPVVGHPRPELRDRDSSVLPGDTLQIPQAFITAQDPEHGIQLRPKSGAAESASGNDKAQAC